MYTPRALARRGVNTPWRSHLPLNITPCQCLGLPAFCGLHFYKDQLALFPPVLILSSINSYTIIITDLFIFSL